MSCGTNKIHFKHTYIHSNLLVCVFETIFTVDGDNTKFIFLLKNVRCIFENTQNICKIYSKKIPVSVHSKMWDNFEKKILKIITMLVVICRKSPQTLAVFHNSFVFVFGILKQKLSSNCFLVVQNFQSISYSITENPPKCGSSVFRLVFFTDLEVTGHLVPFLRGPSRIYDKGNKRVRYLAKHASRSSTRPINNIHFFSQIYYGRTASTNGVVYAVDHAVSIHSSSKCSRFHGSSTHVYLLWRFRIISFSKLKFNDHSLSVHAFNNSNSFRHYGEIPV